jgi:hypothetical protein
MSRVNKILERFDIKKDDLVNDLTRHTKTKSLTSWNNTNIKENQYHQADVLYLPRTQEGYKYLLVVVDVSTRAVQARPLKELRANTIVKAFKSIYGSRGNTLNKPSIIHLDSGPEFKNRIVKNYFDSLNVGIRYSETKRHSQQAIVEAMNKTIGQTISKLLLNEDLSTGQQTTEWVDFLPIILEVLNENKKESKYKEIKGDEPIITHKNKPEILFPEGDEVRIKLNNDRRRAGDAVWSYEPYTIEKILILPNRPVQYMVKGKRNAFTGNELKKYVEGRRKAIVPKYEVEAILGKKKINNKIHYLVKWKGYREKTWEPRINLLKDNLGGLIEEYENKI